MYGAGGFYTTANAAPSGAPFPAGSADNGLSVDPGSGKIVLGNDVGGLLALLLSDREIPTGGFSIFLSDVVNNLLVTMAGNLVKVEETALGLGSQLSIARVSSFSNDAGQAADLVASHFPSNSDFIAVAFNGFSFIQDGAGYRHYQFDHATKNVTIGDATASLSGLTLTVNEVAGSVDILNTAGSSFVSINGVAGFTGTVTPVNSITVNGGIVTAVS